MTQLPDDIVEFLRILTVENGLHPATSFVMDKSKELLARYTEQEPTAQAGEVTEADRECAHEVMTLARLFVGTPVTRYEKGCGLVAAHRQQAVAAETGELQLQLKASEINAAGWKNSCDAALEQAKEGKQRIAQLEAEAAAMRERLGSGEQAGSATPEKGSGPGTSRAKSDATAGEFANPDEAAGAETGLQITDADREAAKKILDRFGRFYDVSTHADFIAKIIAARASQAVAAATGELRAKINAYEFQLSEIVTPDLIDDDGKTIEWTETLPDGGEVPVMRGSPRLAAFIAKLHLMLLDAQKQSQQHIAQLEEGNKNAMGLVMEITVLKKQVAQLESEAAAMRNRLIESHKIDIIGDKLDKPWHEAAAEYVDKEYGTAGREYVERMDRIEKENTDLKSEIETLKAGK